MHVKKGNQMSDEVVQLESQLDSFEYNQRKEALLNLLQLSNDGQINLPQQGKYTNVHFHTFFSYNACGYSPSKIAWLAKKQGLAVAGIVDFDVFDALDEFLNACKILDLRGFAGMETRVFVPEFADKVINSPGEPGISYHMGIGFPAADFKDNQKSFATKLRKIPENRNRDLVKRVNQHFSPVELDYDKDVLPLTPSGNATERHICLAYAEKAANHFEDNKQLQNFWQGKLSQTFEISDLPEGKFLLNTIRAKTMKHGGVGYVQPDAGAFVSMAEVNEFIISANGIPTLTWLDGTSQGEKEIEKLIEIAMETGVAAINIIPDRNYKAGVKDEKLRNLYNIVELAEKLHLPVIAGTEMNSPGQKFVDDFDSEELKPLTGIFLKGACIAYGHLALQSNCQLGYLSSWAESNFETKKDKNEFYEQIGKAVSPSKYKLLKNINSTDKPEAIIKILRNEDQ
jgi:hypothetical protein